MWSAKNTIKVISVVQCDLFDSCARSFSRIRLWHIDLHCYLCACECLKRLNRHQYRLKPVLTARQTSSPGQLQSSWSSMWWIYARIDKSFCNRFALLNWFSQNWSLECDANRPQQCSKLSAMHCLTRGAKSKKKKREIWNSKLCTLRPVQTLACV